MGSKRVPLLVGVAVAGTSLLTATALGAVTQSGPRTGRVEMAAGLTSSVEQHGIQIKAAAGMARTAAGARVPLTVTLRSDVTQVAVVELEAYGPDGGAVFHRTWTDVKLLGGESSTWTVEWPAPSRAGRYQIAVGVFSAGWESSIARNNHAAFVVVAPRAARSAVPTSTSVSAPPTATPPRSTSTPSPTGAAPTGVPTGGTGVVTGPTDTSSSNATVLPGAKKGHRNGAKGTSPAASTDQPLASLSVDVPLPANGG